MKKESIVDQVKPPQYDGDNQNAGGIVQFVAFYKKKNGQ
jgi:hypothetical protein